MNVVNPEPENKISFKRKIIYFVIFCICLIAIFFAVYAQFFFGQSIKNIFKIKNKERITTEYTESKEEFDKIFDNTLEQNEKKDYEQLKIDKEKPIVYTNYKYEENIEGKYNIKVNLPYINIENDTIKMYNKEIKEIFEDKTTSILKSNSVGEIYNVYYKVYITDGILSIIIKSNLKEGSNPQRQIYKTYNFDLEKMTEINIYDLLSKKEIQENDANSTIQTEIKKIQSDVEKLKKSGYEIYERDSNQDIYKIKNVNNFFIGKDSKIFIIFAYGNQNFTSEKDIIIL